MKLNYALDMAIMRHELRTEPTITAGYKIGSAYYENYMSNESWDAFKALMKAENKKAYQNYCAGGGKELEKRRVGANIYPPKMASFGSSSRMIYNIMKSNPNFLFELKLPTKIGGIANLDGFIETDGKCVFVEAKCREPYTKRSSKISDRYASFYDYLSQSNNNNLHCSIKGIDKFEVNFFADGEYIQQFDIKQMLCHLLGIALAYLEGTYNKPIEFIYLLYNPMQLVFETDEEREAIINTYARECFERDCIDFKGVFFDTLKYLQTNYNIGADKDINKITEFFSFQVYDQHTMRI